MSAGTCLCGRNDLDHLGDCGTYARCCEQDPAEHLDLQHVACAFALEMGRSHEEQRSALRAIHREAPTQGAAVSESHKHTFSLIPGETVHIGGIPYGVTEDGRLTGANDPAWARGLRDQRPTVGGTSASEQAK